MNEATAVTEQASAPADVAEFETYQAEANARDVARRRGAAPAEKEASAASHENAETKDNEQQSAEKEASATSEKDPDTAAASEAAKQQQEKDKRKTAATSENRFAKITRENKELRERLARLEAAKDDKRETQQESRPAADAKAEKKNEGTQKPKLDDKDEKTGQPKYTTYEDFQDARDQWLRDEIKRESSASSEKTAREQEHQRAAEVVRAEQQKRVEKARTRYADFDAVALRADLPVKEGTALYGFLLDSDHGTDVLYHLGENPQDLERIQGKPVFKEDGVTIVRFQGGLSPISQVRELTKLEQKYAAAPPPAKKITGAPPPPRQLGGNSATAADEVDRAIKEGDQEAYSRAANARDLARRRGK